MDGVFNHADASATDRDFLYWLYEDPADSPYVGNLLNMHSFRTWITATGVPLDTSAMPAFTGSIRSKLTVSALTTRLGCTAQGSRSRNSQIASELRSHLSRTGTGTFRYLEHSWDYAAIAATNNVGATSCGSIHIEALAWVTWDRPTVFSTD